jgi:YHS domain-containing protein
MLSRFSRRLPVRTALLALTLFALGLSACDSKSSGGGAAATGGTTTKLAVANTICPVEDRAAITDDPAYTVDYKGQKIAFCCMRCPPKFNKEPEKYMERMRKDPKHYGYTAP